MEQVPNEIRVAYTDQIINEGLKSTVPSQVPFTRHFSQSEDFFLKLQTQFTVPSFPIHHDVRVKIPPPEYLEKMRSLSRELGTLLPEIFSGLSYLFDPAEILRPAFFQLYRYNETPYLFLLRLDLLWRPQEHELVSRGNNDVTSEYRSDRLYLEADIIPLEKIVTEGGKILGFQVKQAISQTWVGESGKGYFVQGIWIDREITKFFTKLFLPPGKRIYPYYPYNCKHRAVCYFPLEPEAAKRSASIPLLHRARLFLDPYLPQIEDALKRNDFSENLETFKTIKEKIPPEWYTPWDGIRLRAYLNEGDMKEYVLENTA